MKGEETRGNVERKLVKRKRTERGEDERRKTEEIIEKGGQEGRRRPKRREH